MRNGQAFTLICMGDPSDDIAPRSSHVRVRLVEGKGSFFSRCSNMLKTSAKPCQSLGRVTPDVTSWMRENSKKSSNVTYVRIPDFLCCCFATDSNDQSFPTFVCAGFYGVGCATKAASWRELHTEQATTTGPIQSQRNVSGRFGGKPGCFRSSVWSQRATFHALNREIFVGL